MTRHLSDVGSPVHHTATAWKAVQLPHAGHSQHLLKRHYTVTRHLATPVIHRGEALNSPLAQ